MLNHDNPAHAAADDRLRAEPVIWLTTVNGSGQPQSTPVWFRWDGSEFAIYGAKDSPKIRNIQSNPHVSLHLDGDGTGGGNVIFEGAARIDQDGAPVDAAAEYVAKYRDQIESLGWTLENVARDYPHLIRVSPTRVRIW